MKTLLWLCLLMAVLGSGPASGQQHQHAPPPCQGADLSCATAATPAFGPDGDLWLAWSAGGRVSVGHSRDLGQSFDTIAAVNAEPERIDTGPDARPKIVVNKNAIVVAYAVFQDDHYNGRVMVSRSVDGGASFTAPRPITDDATSQRFETLAIDPEGNIFAAWLDKRNAAAARRAGANYTGAALAYSWSMDGGESFLPTRIALDNVCECCRLGVGFAAVTRPAVVFRNIFDTNTRDHRRGVSRSRYSRAAPPDKRRRLGDRCLSASRSGTGHRRDGHDPCRLVHGRQGTPRALLCALTGWRRPILDAYADG